MKESCANASKLWALEHQPATFFDVILSFCFVVVFSQGMGVLLEGQMSFALKVRSQALRTNMYPESFQCVCHERCSPTQTKSAYGGPSCRKSPSGHNEFSLQDFLFR